MTDLPTEEDSSNNEEQTAQGITQDELPYPKDDEQ